MSDEVKNAAPGRAGLSKTLGMLLRGAGLGCALLALLVIAFLALRPESEIKKINFMPRDVALFFDRHDFLKNVIGFAGLRFALAVALAPWSRTLGGGWRGNLRISAATGALVVCLELVQLTMPRRSFDWNDIAAGMLGIAAVGMPLGLLAQAASAASARLKKRSPRVAA